MNTIVGYWRTLKQYWRTPKGRHDLTEFCWAAIILVVTFVLGWRL